MSNICQILTSTRFSFSTKIQRLYDVMSNVNLTLHRRLVPAGFYLIAEAGRGCGRDGWGPSRCCWFCWSIVQGKYPGWRGEGHRWSLRQCSLSVVGSCCQQHCSSHTRQWCRWSAHSQWCPCRKWWGWVEGDLPFSVGGESVGAIVPSCWVMWRWWSRWDPL